MKKTRCLKYIGALTAALVYTGCVSLVEKTGQFLDGSAYDEKKITVYRTPRSTSVGDMELSVAENRNGMPSVIINIEKFPMMKLRASLPDETGYINLVSLEYLSGNTHGWNEYILEMAGTGILNLRETQAVLFINEKIESVQITDARIHRYDTRITGSEAVTNLRNRRERITAVAEWMSSINSPEAQTIKDFEKYWKPILFPEMVSKKKRPSGWKRTGDQFQTAEDIRWNISYTERVFPQELNAIRNSGTLFKDWEEALSWIYMEYEWKNITELLSKRIVFYKERVR